MALEAQIVAAPMAIVSRWLDLAAMFLPMTTKTNYLEGACNYIKYFH